MANPFSLKIFAAFSRGALPECQWMNVPEVFLYTPQNMCYVLIK
jgi:hypothetical protein